MTKPKPVRPSMSQARRLRIWEKEKGVCYLCGLRVQAGEPWDAEHVIPWTIGYDDSDQNLRVAHKDGCHSKKTKTDMRDIAKCRRMAGETGQAARRAKNGPQIKSRPFPKGGKTNWPKRPFGKGDRT